MSDAASDNPFGANHLLRTAVTHPRPGASVLAVDGEVDTLTAPRLEARLDEVLQSSAAAHDTVVVDLSGVTFLSSSGLAALIRGARRATAAGIPLRLVAATRAVTRPLAVTGADALFDIHADVEAALAARSAAAEPRDGDPAPVDAASADVAPRTGRGGR